MQTLVESRQDPLMALREHALLLFLVMVAGAVIGGVYGLVAPVRFRAAATLRATAPAGFSGSAIAGLAGQLGLSLPGTATGNAMSPPFLREVALSRTVM